MLSSIYLLFKMVSAAGGTLTDISWHIHGPQTGLGKEMNSLQIPRVRFLVDLQIWYKKR